MMSPFSSNGTSLSMKASTALPAFTSIMTRRGFLSLLTMSSRLFAPITLVPEVKREGDDSSGIIMVLMLSIVGKRILTWQLTLGLVCKKVINLLNSSVICTHHKAVIIHIENKVLALRMWTAHKDREGRGRESGQEKYGASIDVIMIITMQSGLLLQLQEVIVWKQFTGHTYHQFINCNNMLIYLFAVNAIYMCVAATMQCHILDTCTVHVKLYAAILLHYVPLLILFIQY